MGRWRPPTKEGSPYITAEGAKRLREELDYLWGDKRPRVTRALAAAAAEGDRSENAEYIYRKKQLGEIDRKIRHLSKRLDVVQVVDEPPDDRERVFFGAWIRLEDDEGEVADYRIVGPDETDAKRRFISMDSPLAKAALGRRVGDEIEVKLPAGLMTYFIEGVRYDALTEASSEA